MTFGLLASAQSFVPQIVKDTVLIPIERKNYNSTCLKQVCCVLYYAIQKVSNFPNRYLDIF